MNLLASLFQFTFMKSRTELRKVHRINFILFYLYIFILFRYFDIKKPFPINFFDKKFKNSLGVILDDVLAGLYVVLTLIIFMIIKSKFF